MALWAQICSNASIMEQVKPKYGIHVIPIEVRHILAHFLESRLLYDNYYTKNLDPVSTAAVFYQDFLNELVRKYSEITDSSMIPLKIRLEEAITAVKGKYAYNPEQLYQYLYDTLQFEAYLIDQQIVGGLENMDYSNMQLGLDQINSLNQGNKSKWNFLKELYEKFFMKVQDFLRLNENFNYLPNCLNGQEGRTQELESSTAALQKEIDFLMEQLTSKRLDLVESFKQTIEVCSKIQDTVFNKYLKDWKDSQIRSRGESAANCRFSLDTIQSWCEVLIFVEYETKLLLNYVTVHKNKAAITEPHIYDSLPELALSVDSLLKNLIELSLVVVQQPPEAVKKSTRFETGVRLLIGNFHGNRQDSLQIKVSIESETQATLLFNHNKRSSKIASENLCNDVTQFEYNEIGRQCLAKFKNLKITDRPKKAEKRTAESVLDEKHYLYFETQFTLGVGADATHYNVRTFSLPVAILTNVSQEYKAMATIFWDSVFVGPNRRDFETPQATSWDTFSKALSDKFEIECGRGLQPNHLIFLRDKFFNGAPPPDATVTWNQFCKTPLEGRSFTFWEWFCKVLSFCKKYLKQMWMANLIVGFISKPDAELKLRNYAPGTFLIRFSDGVPGAIAVAYVNGNKEIIHFGPLDKHTLDARCLVDCIGDVFEFVWLYPSYPKAIFEQFREKERERIPRCPIGSRDYPQTIQLIGKLSGGNFVPLSFNSPSETGSPWSVFEM